MRKDFFEILECARALTFCIKLKTNAVLIREAQAARLRDLGVESIQVSIYSHRPEVHDAITKVPGSLRRSLNAIRFLKSQGLKVIIANVLMTENMHDYHGVRALADELGTECTLDPTVTPMMDGDRSILDLNAGESALRNLFRDEAFVGNADEFCAPPPAPDEDSMESLPCSAGHTACYVSPYGEFYPCVQFPLSCGNVRQQRFIDIWRDSEQLKEVRSIRLRDLSSCSQCAHGSTCTRCPGLAFMEGNMRGPFHRGLREILCPNRHSLGESAGQEAERLGSAPGADSDRTGDHGQQIIRHGRLRQCSRGIKAVRESRAVTVSDD